MKNKLKTYTIIGLAVAALTICSTITVFAVFSPNNTPAATKTEVAGNASQPSRSFGGGFDKGGGMAGMTGMGKKLDLSGLVAAGTIDQATADKITAYMDAKDAERQAEMDKVKDMTDAERQAYFDSIKGAGPIDIFGDMVSSGVITQAQADAIKGAMPQNRQQPGGGFDRGGGMAGIGGRKLDLSGLVAAGTIDQATANKITAYMDAKDAERQAEMDKAKDMTDAERQAYFESINGTKCSGPTNIFDEMVSNGVITQAQADAIKGAMPQAPDRPGKPDKAFRDQATGGGDKAFQDQTTGSGV